MATEFKLYGVEKEDMYANKTKEEKENIRKEMARMAFKVGIKPTARYYNTYPNTVRNWLNKYRDEIEKEVD